MDIILNGKAVVHDFDDISTDQIFPGKYVNLTNPSEIVEHILEGADITLKDRIKTNKILVVGENFGCGSSREHAVIGLKKAGVKVVLASSVGRIWYRNAINLALPVILCEGISKKVTEGDILEVDLKTGEIVNVTKNTVEKGEAMSDFTISIYKSNGIKEMMLNKNR